MTAPRTATPSDGTAARPRHPTRQVIGLASQAEAARNGFTLVELMIVIAIIGIASAAVVFSLPDPHGRLADEAARFATRTRAVRDAAILSARPTSMWVAGGGYGFDDRRGGEWRAMDSRSFAVAQWQPGTRATVATSGRTRVVFDATGTTDTPTTVRLVRADQAETVSIATDGTVRIDG